MNVVSIKKRKARDWKYFDQRLTELRVNDVANIIERGRVLIEAKEELAHGSFEATVKRHFSMDQGQQLMKVARHPVLSNTDHGRLLPASWRTLYELTKLPNDILTAKLKDGTINPRMEKKDVLAIYDEINNPDQTNLIEAIKADPTANQREAAKRWGVSLGVYQRTRNRLIETGEIGKQPSAFAELRAGLLTAMAKLDPQAQRDEMRKLYAEFVFTLPIEQQVEDLRTLVKHDMTQWKTKQFSEMMEITTLRLRR
jgi:hypothetical protein